MVFELHIDYVIICDTFMWTQENLILCDNMLFIMSCINIAPGDEICWPKPHEKVGLGKKNCELPRCIWFINGTLVEIQTPWKDLEYQLWFIGQKKIYKMDNTMVCLFTLTKITLNLTMVLTYSTTRPSIKNGTCISPMG